MTHAEVLRKRYRIGTSTPVLVRSSFATVAPTGTEYSARISAATIDRDFEVLLPSGMVADAFNRSGMLFWNHDYDRPIGFPVRGALKAGAADIIDRFTFLKRPSGHEGTWHPDYVRAVVDQAHALGRSVGVSVGFIPLEGRHPTGKDLQRWPGVQMVFTKWSLLEWSIAPVQSNQEAYTLPSGGRPSEAGHAGRRYVIPVRLVPTRKIYIMPVRMPAIER